MTQRFGGFCAGTATEEHRGPDAIVGITDWGGYLPLDLAGLIGQTWQEAAQGW